MSAVDHPPEERVARQALIEANVSKPEIVDVDAVEYLDDQYGITFNVNNLSDELHESLIAAIAAAIDEAPAGGEK